jgi:hypothetical protein
MTTLVRADQSVELRFGAKMEEQSDLEIRGAEVVQQLPMSGFVKVERGFRLDDYPTVDNQIESLE